MGSFSRQIQIGHMPGRSLFAGIGAVYSSESFKGEDSEAYEGTGWILLLRAWCIDGKEKKTVAGFGVCFAVLWGEHR